MKRNYCTALFLLLSIIIQCNAQKKDGKSELQDKPSNTDKKLAPRLETPQQNIIQYPSPFLSFLPEVQDEKLGLFSEKQTFPRIHPQVLLYPGFAPGQQFLLQPANPPNNFLIPQQPGPEIILRDTPQFFTPVAGFPKPAPVPPVEKDAEEIPTDQVGVHRPAPRKKDTKPEKLETLDSETEKVATEAEVLAQADKNNPNKPTTTNLRPGQRFFFLNGQTLFPGFPHEGLNHFPSQFGGFNFFEQVPQQNTGTPEKQSDVQKSFPFFGHDYLQGFQRNPITGQITNTKDEQENGQKTFLVAPENSVLLNQPLRADDQFFSRIYNPFEVAVAQDAEKGKNAESQKGQESQKTQEEQKGQERQAKQSTFPASATQFSSLPSSYTLLGSDIQHVFGSSGFPNLYDFSFLTQRAAPGREQLVNYDQKNGGVQANTPEDGNPTISEAHPAATAVAGNGGVASAGPKATALTGKRGTSISSPQATAVAGTQDNRRRSSLRKS